MRAGSSASGRRARTWPSWPTSACMRSSIAARNRPGSPSATAPRSWCSRTWAWCRRFSTRGSSVWHNAQPTFRATPSAILALGHNGNLINTLELAELVEPPSNGGEAIGATSDTDVLTALFARPPADARLPGGAEPGIEAGAMAALPLVRGAFSLVFMDERTLYAARDPQGFRPLVLGRLERGWVVASETAALDIVGASFVREIEPGELIAIDERGVRSRTFA